VAQEWRSAPQRDEQHPHRQEDRRQARREGLVQVEAAERLEPTSPIRMARDNSELEPTLGEGGANARAPAKSRVVRFVPLAALAQVSGGRQLAVASHEHTWRPPRTFGTFPGPASGGARWPHACRHQKHGVPGSWTPQPARSQLSARTTGSTPSARSTTTTEARPVSRLLVYTGAGRFIGPR
jgi:hypothetical protein